MENQDPWKISPATQIHQRDLRNHLRICGKTFCENLRNLRKNYCAEDFTQPALDYDAIDGLKNIG